MNMPQAMTETTVPSLRRMSVEEGLRVEQSLLEAVCEGESDKRILAWQPSDRALVMPRRHERAANFTQVRLSMEQQGWPILFRATGGEPVPQSPQVINLAMVLRCRVGRSSGDLEWAYRRLGDPWCDWLASLGVSRADLGSVSGAYCDGRFNVRIAGHKLVGTAQRWRRVRGSKDMAVLVHGVMQVEGNPAELVAVVNDFQAAIDDPQRFQAASHIALRDVLPDLDIEGAIPGLLKRLVTSKDSA